MKKAILITAALGLVVCAGAYAANQISQKDNALRLDTAEQTLEEKQYATNYGLCLAYLVHHNQMTPSQHYQERLDSFTKSQSIKVPKNKQYVSEVANLYTEQYITSMQSGAELNAQHDEWGANGCRGVGFFPKQNS